MPSFDETYRTWEQRFRARIVGSSELPEYEHRIWDLTAFRTQYEPVTTFQAEAVRLHKEVQQSLAGLNLIENLLAQGIQVALSARDLGSDILPVVQRALQQFGGGPIYLRQLSRHLSDRAEHRSFSLECRLLALSYLEVQEVMPEFSSQGQQMAELERLQAKLGNWPSSSNDMIENAQTLSERGMDVTDELLYAREFEGLLDSMTRQIKIDSELFLRRLRSEHRRAREDPAFYWSLTSNPGCIHESFERSTAESDDRLQGIELLVHYIELHESDPERDAIYEGLYANHLIRCHLLAHGESIDNLKNVLAFLVCNERERQFEEFCRAFVREAVHDHGVVPAFHDLAADIETVLAVDLGYGPQARTAELATPAQIQALKVAMQILAREVVYSQDDFARLLGSETEAERVLKHVSRLCVKFLQDECAYEGGGRPDHYRRWEGGIQRMIRDLWSGSVHVEA